MPVPSSSTTRATSRWLSARRASISFWTSSSRNRHLLARVRDRTLGGAGDEPRVLADHATGLELRRLVVLQAGFDLVVGDVEVDAARVDVDRDRVALAHGGDRAAVDGLGGDVAGHEPARSAGEAAVGEQRDAVAEPLPHDRRGHREHLAHAGAAGRALVADHDHIALVDLAGGDRLHGRLLAVEDARGALVEAALVSGELDDAALGREVAAQDREPAG